MTGLNKLTAVELRRGIGDQDIPPVDLMNDCIAAIETKTP